MTTPELPPQITALLGKEFTFTAPEEVGRGAIRKFALSVGDLNPLYLDPAYAAPWGGLRAPPTFICESWHYLTGEVDEEGHFLQAVQVNPGGRILRGGNDYRFFQPVRPEDVVTATWKVAEAYWREGRTGRLLFIITEISYTNQRQEPLATNRELLIFQFPP